MGCLNSKLNNISDDLTKSNFDTPLYSLNNNILLGKVVYVYDGDTCHIVFKINNQLVKYVCRLQHMDSPEICPKNISDETQRKNEINAAIKARNFVLSQVTNTFVESDTSNKLTKNDIKDICSKNSKIIRIKCGEFDKYGRLLVELYTDSSNISINDLLINKKLAVRYEGGTKEKFNTNNFV